MSAQRLSFATTDKPQPSAELKKWRTLPSLYFWKRRIGQIRSTSELTSQHIPSNLIIFGWSRIKGWHSIPSSVIGSLKLSETSRIRLKAKLNCKLTNDWLTLPYPPWPSNPKPGCHVVATKSTLYFWAIEMKARKSSCGAVLEICRTLWEEQDPCQES